VDTSDALMTMAADEMAKMSKSATDLANDFATKGNEAYLDALKINIDSKSRSEFLGRSHAFYEAADAIRTAFDLHAPCSICRRRHGREVQHAAD
jgi:phenylalanyl-tRNA synthetase alpha subunit